MRDIFLEYMIKRRRDGMDMLKTAGYILAALILTLVTFVAVMSYVPSMSSIMFLLIAGIWYLAYRMISSLNIEYEYIFTNGFLDIDTVINRSRRKKLLSVRTNELTFMGKVGEFQAEYNKAVSDSNKKKVRALKAGVTENSYFATFSNDGKESVLLFDPPTALVAHIKKYNPRRVHADAAIEE